MTVPVGYLHITNTIPEHSFSLSILNCCAQFVTVKWACCLSNVTLVWVCSYSLFTTSYNYSTHGISYMLQIVFYHIHWSSVYSELLCTVCHHRMSMLLVKRDLGLCFTTSSTVIVILVESALQREIWASTPYINVCGTKKVTGARLVKEY